VITVAAVIRIADLAEKITTRLSVYRSALAADMRRFRTQFGDGPVYEALQLIEQRDRVTVADWDAAGHARQVQAGLMRAVAEHHEREADDPLTLPTDWR
jgi:hypothetical protein